MSSINLNSSEDAQGAVPAKIENRDAFPVKLSDYLSEVELSKEMSKYIVRMDSQGLFFFKDSNGNIDFANPIRANDMLMLLNDAGLKKLDVLTKKNLVTSRWIERISPLSLLFDVIAQEDWNDYGRDYISQFVKDLKLEGNFENNRYLWTKYLTTSFCVALAGYDKKIIWNSFPRVIPILVSKETARGKTGVMKKLFLDGIIRKISPEIGMELYAESFGDFPDDKKETDAYFTNCFGLNIDDIDKMIIDKRKNGKLKARITSTSAGGRDMYAQSISNAKRTVALVGTSNNEELLSERTETRYMPFKVTDNINFDNLDKLEFVLGIWRQARYLAHQLREESQFTSSDLSLVMDNAKQFTYRKPFERFLEDEYEFDSYGVLTFTEIKESLAANSFYPRDREISTAIEKIIPTGEVATRRSSGKYYIRVIKKECTEYTKEIRKVKAGDGLPF